MSSFPALNGAPGIDNFQADFNSLSARALAYLQSVLTLTPPVVLTNTNAAQIPLSVVGAAAQAANLQEWRDSSSALMARVSPTGLIAGVDFVHSSAGLSIGGASSTPQFSLLPISGAAIHIASGGVTTNGTALRFREIAAPAAPAANCVYLYAQDNGAGKTQLMALFSTGAAQQVAIEP